MMTTEAVIRLSDLRHDQEAECFAALAKKVPGTTKAGKPFLKCYFRDQRAELESPLWADSRFLQQAAGWVVGIAYRLKVKAELKGPYGLQLQLIDIRPAGEEDTADGYDFTDLVEPTRYPAGYCLAKIHELIDGYIDCVKLKAVVRLILAQNAELFDKIPAAVSMHHSQPGGLVEHVWSVTRISTLLVKHYACYYNNLNPPLSQDVVVAAAVLHDIGKLRELKHSVFEASYTTEGTLIGHILIGRDMVRDAAREVGDVPEETMLLLEHAILAHHGKLEFGSPKLPLTIEALILSVADDLDAKVNAVARERLKNSSDLAFTGKIYAVDRAFYKGVPVERPDAEPEDVA